MVRSSVQNPRVVKVTYEISQTFKVPIGTDLNDKSQVAEWSIQDQQIWIKYTNGTVVEEPFINEMVEIDDYYQLKTYEDDADSFDLQMFEDEIEEYRDRLEYQKPITFFNIQIKRLKRNPLVQLGFFMRLDRRRCGFC